MDDVRITTEHLKQLAANHDEAALGSQSATDVASGISKNVWITHGVASSASNSAFTQAENARRNAGERLKRASNELAAKLRDAANAYESTDKQTSENIAKQLRSY
jgi:hypothetical protein